MSKLSRVIPPSKCGPHRRVTVNVRETGTDRKTGKTIVAPYITFADEYVDVTANEAMQAASESKAPTARNQAKEFLVDLLTDNPTPSADVEEAAKANGIPRRTLFRAKAELKIVAMKDGPMKEGQRTWRWHLPQAGETAATDV